MPPLYFVFTIRDDDILNCRMATYSRQKAEDAQAAYEQLLETAEERKTSLQAKIEALTG